MSALNATGTTGLVTNNLDGTFAYDPNGQFESLALGQQTTDAFSYTVADDGNPQATDTATVTITINGANDNPTAVADTGVGFTTDEDTVFTTGNVLTNDTDPDTGDVLSVSVLDTTGTQGLVTDNLNGTFSYDPNGQFDSLTAVQQTTDTFSYTASDGNGGTSTTTVTITVNGLNDDPNVVADTGAGFTTDEDTAFTTGNVLANDTDPDTGDTLSVSVLDTTGTVGLVTDNLDGTFAYDPNGQFESLALGEQATDTFGYTASDGNGGASTTTATITINGVNDNPTAVADTGVGFTTDEDSAFTTGNVLTNDTDPDASDTLSVSVLDTTGTVGLVTDNLNGTFSYDPNGQFEALNAGQQTTDTFSYTVSDGNGGTSTTTVTITIDGADEAQNVTFDFKIQGRSTANTVNWTMPFEVEFYNAGTSVLAISATPTSATSANNASSFIVATVPVGTYDVWAKGENTLAVFLTNVVVSAASTLFDLGVQQGGDAIGDTGTDPDNMVTIADYSAFQTIPFGGLTSTLTVVQQRQDHNRDGFVDIVDYAIIVGNFNQQGDLKP